MSRHLLFCAVLKTHCAMTQKLKSHLCRLLRLWFSTNYSVNTWYINYIHPHFKQTVSVLEERLTLTEDKLKECLLQQSKIFKDVRSSGERRRTDSRETDGSSVHFTWGRPRLLTDGSTNTDWTLLDQGWKCAVCVCHRTPLGTTLRLMTFAFPIWGGG